MLNYLSKPSAMAFVQKYGDVHPLLKRLESTRQDNVWHAEGDVLIHTDMVLRRVYDLLDSDPLAQTLTSREKTILMFSAMYHDYGKPVTTKDEERNGRVCVVASGHEFVGSSLLFNLDAPNELTQEEWLSVVKLVAYHQMPKKAVHNDFGEGEYIKLLRHCGDTRLLYLLEVADIEGRICNDADDELTFLSLFKSVCEEYGVFCTYNDYYDRVLSPLEASLSTPTLYRGLADFAEGKIHSLDTISCMSYAHEKRPTIYLMCGLAGGGKSTYVNNYLSHCLYVSLDKVRKDFLKNEADQSKNDEVRRVATKQLREMLRTGNDIVFDATFIRADHRAPILELAHAYGYASKVVVIQTTVNKSLELIKTRERQVPRDVVEGMYRGFQLPNLGEAEQIEYVLIS
ncbi:AAA family ATPase [Vibrio coralliirubri]|uniref:AAA family ATPase n=1 Tax=Vibrio coralliirubri TaxID=1516159 RepID=UPI002284DD9B|nr:AAA family ATPase [Vibrio coralliirubri]MCY9861174.1 AAA family ATPase [Vibrio coralliirubri]